MPMNNQQPQLQDPTPQRDRRIMLRTRVQGRETWDRIGESEGGAKKRTKPDNRCRRGVGNGGDLGGNRKKRNERVGSVVADPDNLENSEEAGRERKMLRA